MILCYIIPSGKIVRVLWRSGTYQAYAWAHIIRQFEKAWIEI